MAPLPPREQRHPLLRHQGLEYSNQDIAAFKERLERIHDKDLLGPPPSYTLIRDPVLRLCHRMMAHSIAGRKSMALILGGQFIARLAEQFGLLTEERLQGLTVTVPALLIIDMAVIEGDVGRVAEEALVAPGGGDEYEEMPQAVPSPPRTQGERIAQLEEEVHGMREVLQGQREVLNSMACDFSMFSTWTITSLSRMMNRAVNFSTIVREYVTEPSTLSKSRAKLRRESVYKSVKA
nr:hypothetical protein [Tanacetum cinerariifolium]